MLFLLQMRLTMLAPGSYEEIEVQGVCVGVLSHVIFNRIVIDSWSWSETAWKEGWKLGNCKSFKGTV